MLKKKKERKKKRKEGIHPFAKNLNHLFIFLTFQSAKLHHIIITVFFLSFGEEMSAYPPHGYCSFVLLTQGFKHLQRSMALTSTKNSIQIPAPFSKLEL